MANPLLFANNAQTTLAGSITNVATTANLAPGSGALFPAPGVGQYFKLTFIDQSTGLLREIVHVTAVVADAITMVRAQEGTTALAWSAGDIAANFVTAGTQSAFRQAAVPIDLSTTDVANTLPLSRMPASNTVGGIPVFTPIAGSPNGALAGHANVNGTSDMAYDTSNKILYVCTSSGPASGAGQAVWSTTALGGVPTGAYADFAGTVAPFGYLACDGSAVNRLTFSALFAVIGTLYGAGDGSTTFNLPNFSRRVAVGSGGTASGVLGNTVSSLGGAETHTLTSGEVPAGTYNVNDPQHHHVGGIPDSAGGSYYGMVAPHNATSSPSDRDALTAGLASGNSYQTSNESTGIGITDNNGGGAHTIMQPSIVVLKIIKT